MTEIKTNEQILAKSLDTTVEKLYNSGFVHQALKAMQESNDQAVRVALEMAAEKAILDRIAFVTDKKVKGYDYVIDKHSITSIHSQVMDKLKTPIQ